MSPLHVFEGLGLELEYMIVDRASMRVLPMADQFLDALRSLPPYQNAVKMDWSHELALHVVELKNTTPAHDLYALGQGMTAELARARRALERFNATLMPGSMHPWMNPREETRLWPHEQAEIYQAYHRIFNCFDHGWANIQSLQLNLPFADDAELARLHAAARLIVPLIPALAASSPVIEGRISGHHDTRLMVYGTHQARVRETIGQVIPEPVASYGEYRRTVQAPMYAAIAAHDPEGVLQHEWLDVRAVVPRISRHAIEIRTIDSQECPRADLAVAQVITGAIRWVYDARSISLGELQSIDTATLAGMMRACSRQGASALILEPNYLRVLGLPAVGLEAGTLWQWLVLRAREAGARFEPSLEAPLHVLLNQGPLSRRILRALGPSGSLARQLVVWRHLCRCLMDNEMFCSPGSP